MVKAEDSHPRGCRFEPRQAPYTRWMLCCFTRHKPPTTLEWCVMNSRCTRYVKQFNSIQSSFQVASAGRAILSLKTTTRSTGRTLPCSSTTRGSKSSWQPEKRPPSSAGFRTSAIERWGRFYFKTFLFLGVSRNYSIFIIIEE